jgi:hypothetical protein
MENLSHEIVNRPRAVTTRIVFDIETFAVLEQESYLYSGPWELVKGSPSQTEMNTANTQMAGQNTLAQGQLGLQQGAINAVNAQLDPMIANGGLAPGVQNAMTSLVMNNVPSQFSALQGGINNNLVARGISGGQGGAGSGQAATQFGQLGAMEGALQQQGLSNIQTQKQSALMNDLQMKAGLGSMYGQNVGTFNSGASSALGSGVNAANAATQATTGLTGSIIGGLTGLGATAMTGGMSNLFSGLGPALGSAGSAMGGVGQTGAGGGMFGSGLSGVIGAGGGQASGGGGQVNTNPFGNFTN